MRLKDDTLWLHQSDLSHYVTCPEQFRVSNGIQPRRPGESITITDDTYRVESDAATIGTCIHAVIERELRKGPFANLGALKTWAKGWMGRQIMEYMEAEVEYRTETYGGNAARIMAAVYNLCESWWASKERDYWMHRDHDSYYVEHEFDVEFVTRPENKLIRQVRLAGTADIIDLQENRVLDWKSSGRAYQRWEKQRWAHQATVYTYAAAEEQLISANGDGLYRFDYRVFLRNNKVDEPQELTVMRGPGQWAWVTSMVNNIADMMESDANQWPVRDDHALCGPKWCPIWNDCKGAFVSEDWT